MIPTDPPRRKPPPKTKRWISPAEWAWLDRVNGQLAYDEYMQWQREFWLGERPVKEKEE